MRFEVSIPGMLAVHARHAVFTALAGVEGIIRAEVELGRAVVEHDGRATAAGIVEALAAAGYEGATVRAIARQLPTL